MKTKARRQRAKRRGSKVFVCAILIALVILGWLIQGTLGLERTLLNEAFYRELMEELNLYAPLRAYLLQRLGEGREALLIEQGSVFSDAVAVAVSEDWVRRQTEALIQESLFFVKGQRLRLHLVLDLQEREHIFREALLEGLTAQLPPQLDQLALSKEVLRQFIDQLDFPDQVTLIDLAKEQLPDPSKRALNLLQLSRGLLGFLPYVLSLILALLCLLWAGIPGGLTRVGGALLCSAVSCLLLLAAAGPALTALLTRKYGGSEVFEALFTGGADALSSAVGATLREVGLVSCVYGGIGLVLLAAGLAAARRSRGLAGAGANS